MIKSAIINAVVTVAVIVAIKRFAPGVALKIGL